MFDIPQFLTEFLHPNSDVRKDLLALQSTTSLAIYDFDQLQELATSEAATKASRRVSGVNCRSSLQMVLQSALQRRTHTHTSGARQAFI
eukprot:4634518-Amphidinium_carterae.1